MFLFRKSRIERNKSFRNLRIERLDSRQLLAAGISPHHNSSNPFDVNDDKLATALDALIVINRLAILDAGEGEQDLGLHAPSQFKVDVNNDDQVSALDALLIINELQTVNSVAQPQITSIERLPSDAGVFDFRLSGTAVPGSVLEIQQSGIALDLQTHASESGHWEMDVEDAGLNQSKFSYSVVQLDALGAVVGQSNSMTYQPNIVLVSASDMRYEQMRFMPFLQSLQVEATSFSSAYVPTSQTSSSKATLLSGNHPSRHGLINDALTLGSSLNQDFSSTLPSWMSSAGYHTGLFGQDRNRPQLEAIFSSQDVMIPRPGWDDYFSNLNKGNTGFDQRFTDNGNLFQAGLDDHVTDVIRDQAIDFIHQTPEHAPFFAYVAPASPQSPGTPAARHQGLFSDIEIPKPDSYAPSQDAIDETGYLELQERVYRSGSESLLAIDEALESIVDELGQLGKLDNTVVIFTSDQGKGIGEHGMFVNNQFDEESFWEESIHVPLVIWDGRSLIGQQTSSLATTMDITGTILDLADANPTGTIDGLSLVPVISDPTDQVRDDFLLQHAYGLDSELQREHGVHDGRMVYVETDYPTEGSTRFLFDLSNDPLQLNNLVDDQSYQTVLGTLDARLDELRGNDREGPEILDVQWTASGTQFDQPQMLALMAEVSDTNTGGSEVRTPSLSYDRFSAFPRGTPLEAIDGVFDSESETTFQLLDFRKVESRHVYLTARDVNGNLSDQQRVRLDFGPEPKLSSDSDTGQSSSDGITLDSTPTFTGHSQPGARIALFAANSFGKDAAILGTSMADSLGQWSITTSLESAGQYTIYGQVGSPASAANESLDFLAPLKVHLLAYPDGNVIRAKGTDAGDEIIVSETVDGEWAFRINGVEAGTMSAADQIIVDGSVGDDLLRIDGDIPSRLLGGAGNDRLHGGTSNDTLIGGAGGNTLEGGLGNDVYQMSFGVSQLSKDTRAYRTTDSIVEQIGEGIDRIRFLGDVEVEANFTENGRNPGFVLQTPFGYQRLVTVNEPSAIERVDGNQLNATWEIPTSVDLRAGAGDDTTIFANTTMPGVNVNLSALQIGGDANEIVDAFLRVDAGSIQVSSQLPSTITVIEQTTASVRLAGTRAQVNLALIRGQVSMISNAAYSGDIRVTMVSSPLGQPLLIQSDSLVVPVARQIALEGEPVSPLSESGRNLRVFSSMRVVDSSQSFAGGSITIGFDTTPFPGDALLILAQVPGPRSITLESDSIFYGDTEIGILKARSSLSDAIQLEFTEAANAVSVGALLRRVGYRSLSPDPTIETRSIRLVLIGASGANATQVAEVNLDRPSTEPAAPILVFPSGDVVGYDPNAKRYIAISMNSRVEIALDDFSGGQLSIDLEGGAAVGETLRLLSGVVPNLDPVFFNSATGVVTYDDLYIGNVVSSDAGSIDIVFSENATEKIIESVLNRVQYRNLYADASTPDRGIRFTLIGPGSLESVVAERSIVFR